MTPLRVLVVDDEPPARRRLCRLLAKAPGIRVVGQAGDGEAAIAQALTLEPDVVLLDCQMPGPAGPEVVARLPHPRPRVIFVTAFERFAVRAFELDAVDYLLKPVTPERLSEAIARARRAPDLRHAPRAESSPVATLAVRATGRVDLIPIDDIEWVEAADNYVLLHTASGRHMLREPLTRLTDRLDPRRFLRVHRSATLALDRVVRLEPQARGDWFAVLKNGTRVPVSRTRRAAVFARIDVPGSSTRPRGTAAGA